MRKILLYIPLLLLYVGCLVYPVTNLFGQEDGADCASCCDNVDNDGDGFVDWEDFDCNQSGNPADDCPYCASEAACFNGADDDNDGLIDSDDPDCAGATPPGTCSSPIWYEDFESYTDGTTSSSKWTSSGNNCDGDGPVGAVDGNYWGVYQGEFRINDIEGITCCGTYGQADNYILTETIDVSAYDQVSISMSARVEGAVECDTPNCTGGGDLLLGQWQIDGGGWNTFYTICGAADGFSAIDCDLSTAGNDLEIRILGGNMANDENYYVDNIYVCDLNCSGQPLKLKDNKGKGGFELEKEQGIQFNIYPVPVKDELLVQFQDHWEGNLSLTIYNLLGQEVWANNFSAIKNNNDSPILHIKDPSISELEAGMYILSVNGMNIHRTETFLVE